MSRRSRWTARPESTRRGARRPVGTLVPRVRNDRFVQRYGAPVEQVKGPELRGSYLAPELYGQPIERGLQHLDED